MSTIKHRINVSIPEDVRIAIENLSKRDQMPSATKAARLIEIGLSVEEDEVWDEIASKRDQENSKFYSHSDVFRQ